MIKMVRHNALAAAVLFPLAASAEPTTLRLAYFTSDQSISYRASVKPFVDAVNAAGGDLIRIEPFTGGALGRDIAQQPELLRSGTADIAFVVPGYTPKQFPDNAVVELAGLFTDIREATLVFTRLTAANALKGYEDFFVIGAYVSAPETFHSRLPITSLRDLQGRKIRVNNPSEAALLNALGATPVPMAVTQVSSAIGDGRLDAALVPPTPLVDYGIKRVANHHYLLETSGAPLMLLMSRRKFDALPEAAQNVIRKYSGVWMARQFIDAYEVADRTILDELKADPRRTVTQPSASDRSVMSGVFTSVIETWAAENPRNRTLLQTTRDEIARVRQTR